MKKRRKRCVSVVRSLGTWPKTTGIRKEKKKRKSISQNKFEVLASKMMKYGVELKRQETKERG